MHNESKPCGWQCRGGSEKTDSKQEEWELLDTPEALFAGHCLLRVCWITLCQDIPVVGMLVVAVGELRSSLNLFGGRSSKGDS